MSTKELKRQTPEYSLVLLKRDGWEIEYQSPVAGERAILHRDGDFKRAQGVYYFLIDHPSIMIKLGEQFIAQQEYDRPKPPSCPYCERKMQWDPNSRDAGGGWICTYCCVGILDQDLDLYEEE